MKLFLIDKPGCHHIKDLMPGIKSVYQLEQEFSPYLFVEFLPNREEPPGILLIAGNEVIRRNYTFDDPNDIEELRNLIWKYIRKYNKVKDVTKDGCITDFRKTRTNHVIQGWQSAKRHRAVEMCCRTVKKMIATEFMDQLIKHEVYRFEGRDMQDRNICKKNRLQECGNNYPQNTILYKRCTDEARWICNNGYPVNIRTKIVDAYRERLKDKILRYLHSNGMRVNKQVLDKILQAGFFERVRNRVGNKFAHFRNVEHAVNEIMNDHGYYTELIEGFDSTRKDKKFNYLYIIFIITLLTILMYIIRVLIN